MSRKSPKAIAASKSQTTQQTTDLQPESLETEELATQEPVSLASQISPIGNTPNPNAHAAMINRAAASPQSSQQVILQLQRQYGNRYVNRVLQQTRQLQTPIQAKLTLGAVGDKYEQEADRVAKQVVNQIQTSQSPSTTQTASVQREMMPEEDELRMKPVDIIQREGVLDEENELGMNAVLQRSPTADGGTITPDLEASIQQARGSGQPLADNIRQPMEQAFGADFSGVKVHMDTQSDQLNQAVQAKAFTTGQDIFFAQGEYSPGSSAGQELLAHELTHVVQQKGKQKSKKQEDSVGMSGEKVHLNFLSDNMPAIQRKFVLKGKEFTNETQLEDIKNEVMKEIKTRNLTDPEEIWQTIKEMAQDDIDEMETDFETIEGLVTEAINWNEDFDSENFKKLEKEQISQQIKQLKTAKNNKKKRKQKNYEEKLEELEILEEEMTHLQEEGEKRKPMYKFSTSNLEKFGESTKAERKHKKRAMTTNTVDLYQPTAHVMQELTNPKHFFDGSKRIPGVMQRPIKYYNEEGERELKQQRKFKSSIKSTKLEETYEVDKGVQFTSGNYHENYSMMVKSAEVMDYSVCKTINLEDGKVEDATASIGFSSKEKINRRLVMWKLVLNASPYTLRPSPYRDVPTAEVYLGVVHTSPSINIKDEISKILEYAKQESNITRIPVVLIGDFYMQKSAEDIWKNLQDGKYEYWQIVYPENITNFPREGEGQIADHAVINSNAFNHLGTQTILPPKSDLEALEEQSFIPNQDELRKAYTSMGVDHAQVITSLEIDPEKYPVYHRPEQRKKYEEDKNL